jgi:cyclopropane fatty-acyl-phospholipid synthase-like methyltransferase
VAQPQAEHARRVVGYYRSPESRLAYRLLLGGTKHFGYYPEGGGRLSMTTAMRRMEDKLGQTLALPPGARVLDAGCGEGDVAVRLGTRFGLEVDGVDLLEANLRRARAKAARLGWPARCGSTAWTTVSWRSRTSASTAPTPWRRWSTPSTTAGPWRSCAGSSSRAGPWPCSSTWSRPGPR